MLAQRLSLGLLRRVRLALGGALRQNGIHRRLVHRRLALGVIVGAAREFGAHKSQ